MSNFNHVRTNFVPFGSKISEPQVVILDDVVSFVNSSDDGSTLPPPDTMTIKNQLDAGLPLKKVNTSILGLSDSDADTLLKRLDSQVSSDAPASDAPASDAPASDAPAL